MLKLLLLLACDRSQQDSTATTSDDVKSSALDDTGDGTSVPAQETASDTGTDKDVKEVKDIFLQLKDDFIQIFGVQEHSWLGKAGLIVADMDRDGYADVAIGSPAYTVYDEHGSVSSAFAGRVDIASIIGCLASFQAMGWLSLGTRVAPVAGPLMLVATSTMIAFQLPTLLS